MKALTFKKSAVATALLAVSGLASANTLFFTTDTAPAAIPAVAANSTKLVAAYERATDAAFAVDAASTPAVNVGEGTVLTYKATSLAPQNGNLIKISFTNGGIAGNAANYKIMWSDADAADIYANAATQIVAKEESNGVISSITFVVAAGAYATGDSFVLVGADSTVGAATGTATIDAPAVMLSKGVASGANLTADWQIIDAANGNEISGGAVNAVTIASTATGVSVAGFNGGSSTVDVINFAKDALEFVDGKTVVTGGVGFQVTDKAGTFTNNLSFDFPAGDANQPDTFAKAAFTVTADKCNAVDTQDNNKAADDVKIGSTGLTASTTKACTWTSGLINVTSDQDLSITVDGKTKLENATWSYSAAVALGTNDFATASVANIAKAYKTVTGTAFTFTSDVQGDAFELPYIYHIGTGTGYSSFVKLVNKTAKSTAANANNTVEVAFDAVILNTVTKEEFTVSNYKLGAVMNQGQYSFSGTDVINALKTPVGKATEGFNETAMDLDAAQNYHIALRLIPRNVSNNANFYVDVQNTAPVGRAQGAAERK